MGMSPVYRIRDIRQEFLAKLYFAQDMDPVEIKKLILEQKSVCDEWLTMLQTSYDGLAIYKVYEKMIFQFRIEQTRAVIEWLDNYMVNIQSVDIPNSGKKSP